MATVKFRVFCSVKALLIVAPPAACSATSISSSAGNIPNAYDPQKARENYHGGLKEAGLTKKKGCNSSGYIALTRVLTLQEFLTL